jgi:hypothetical protein
MRQGRRWLMLFLSVIVGWLATPASSLAHEGDGIDVGFALVTAEQAGGVVTVSMTITEAEDCRPFEAGGLSAARAEQSVSGVLQPADACVFNGTIELPEPGRWTLSVAVNWDGYPTSIVLPVGVSAEPGTFERAEWLHVTLPQERPFRSTRTAISAAVGLLLGGVWEITRRRRARHRLVPS